MTKAKTAIRSGCISHSPHNPHSPMIHVIVIDDEPLALQQMQRMVGQIPYFTLVAACESALDAIKAMTDNTVDVIFTDVNMPDMSGLDFVHSLPTPPIIVITTAYSQYAIEGFKADAIDYLLKPFGQVDFLRVAEKVKKQYELLHPLQEESSAPTAHRTGSDILFVKDGYNIVRISVSDIMYIESQSEYQKIHMADGKFHMPLMSIKRLAELLPEDTFLRIHRSYIVNMNHVVDISRMRIRMPHDVVLPVGESYKEHVQTYIGKRMIGR